MRQTLAAILFGTTLLASACAKKSEQAPSATGDMTTRVSVEEAKSANSNMGAGSAYNGPQGQTATTVAPSPIMAKESDGKEMAARGYAMDKAGGGETMTGNSHTDYGKNPWVEAKADHLSTFAADVDTASYSQARRALEGGALPVAASVRPEEFVNYFKYTFAAPTGNTPFTVVMEAAPSPVNAGRHILRVGVATKAISTMERKPAHLVFLVDVSGSMNGPDRIELAKESLRKMTKNLKEDDTVSLVTYAGSTRVVLEPTSAAKQDKIFAAIDDLRASGSTGMASGIDLAYERAAKSLKPGHISRVVILSDGDANVGPHTHEELLKIITARAKEGVTLSTIGFGSGNYRDTLMEQLADKGNGNNYYIDSQEQATRVFETQLTQMLEVVAKDVKLQVDFDKEMVSRYRLVGYENRDIKDDDFRQDKVDAGEVGAGHQVTALYEIELTAKGKQAKAPLGAIRIRHKEPTGSTATEAAFPMVGGPAESFANSSVDFRFAFAAAAFADFLRGGEDAEHWSLANIRDLAKLAAGDSAERKELVSLIEKAIEIKNRQASR